MRCHHPGCTRESKTGHWCQACIEVEWPYASFSLDDGEHWIVWKGVQHIQGNLFRGAVGCPYIPSRITHWVGPCRKGSSLKWIAQRPHNWLLSPLGAVKAGYGNYILAAIVFVAGCRLRDDLVIDSVSPAFSLAAFPRAKLPSLEKATRLLADVNAYAEEIEAFEHAMREALFIPRRYASVLSKAESQIQWWVDQRHRGDYQGLYGIYQELQRLRRVADALAMEIAPRPSIESAMLNWLNRLGEDPNPLQRVMARLGQLWIAPFWPSRYRQMWKDYQIIQHRIRALELRAQQYPSVRNRTDPLRQLLELVSPYKN